MAYVEFFTEESVEKALAVNNKPFIIHDKEIPHHEIKILKS